MLETFKARLKAKTKAAGVNLSQTRIDAIADRLHKKNPDLTEEADHDARIDDLDALSPFADIARQDDRVRTLEAKSKGQQQRQEDQDANDDEDGNDQQDSSKGSSKKKGAEEPPAWAKGLIETVKALSSDKAQTSMKQKVSEKLKDVVPEAYYKGRVIPEKEEDLEAFVDEVKADYTTFKQDLVNQGLMTATTPTGGEAGKVNEKAFDASVDAWVASKVEKKPS